LLVISVMRASFSARSFLLTAMKVSFGEAWRAAVSVISGRILFCRKASDSAIVLLR